MIASSIPALCEVGSTPICARFLTSLVASPAPARLLVALAHGELAHQFFVRRQSGFIGSAV